MLRRVSIWGWLALAISALGLFLRVEHAITFDQAGRASDYAVHLQGVRWMQEHWRPFFHAPTVNYQVRSYPPLWYFLSAALLKFHDNERYLAVWSLLGWVLRHFVLWRILSEALPGRKLSRLVAITLHAVLPLSVLVDGKVNPEGLHAGIFAVALYMLWRIEREWHRPGGVSLLTAAAFGALAGLALLAKITGALLTTLGAVVFLWLFVNRARLAGLKSAWLMFARPALAAGAMWCVVAGWWVGTNLVRFKQPFPHVWNLAGPSSDPSLAQPALYRRPFGWVMPFEWKSYLEFPLLRTPTDPRPNFWATEVVGTWTDIYNRGFCRLKGGEVTDKVWGARHGWMSQNLDSWSVNQRCVNWFSAMAYVGLLLSLAAVVAVAWCLWQNLRSRGARNSLALPLTTLACTSSALWFALSYPWDHIAALNPRYLLSQVMPMSACLGFGLAQLEALSGRGNRRAVVARGLLWAVTAASFLIGSMLVYERFGGR